MPGAFSFGVADFVAVAQFSKKIYQSCESAPGVFGTISRDLDSLHCVLEEAGEAQMSYPLTPRREARLRTILDGCNSVLGDLQYIVQKYQSLGTDDKNALDRIRLGGEDIAEIRSRLVFNITLLTAFRSYIVGPSTFEGETLPKREFGSWQWVVELSGPESPKRSIAPSISDKTVLRSETDTTTLVDIPQEPLLPQQKSKSRPGLRSFFSSRKRRLISNVDNKNLQGALQCLNDDTSSEILDQEALDHALWSATRFPSTPLMEALLEKGANMNVVRGKHNVLWNAVTANNKEAVCFLLSKGVNLNVDHLVNTALPMRAALRSESMMSLLARNGAPVNDEHEISGSVRFNILQEAISQGRESIVRVLLDAGVNVDAYSSTNGTALMIALAFGRESIAKRLIQKGANVNATRTATETCLYTNPVEAAILGRDPKLLEMLFRAGAVTDMPQAMRFAMARSEYPLIPTAGSQYGFDTDGTRKFYVLMCMLAQRDLRYVLYFTKSDSVDVKRRGILKMMNELHKIRK